MKSVCIKRIGYIISYTGIFIILVWIGIFKFTPTEADAIKRLVENQPLTSWLYSVLSVQNVSNVIGTIEILTAVIMILALRWTIARKIAGVMIVCIFLVTLSFLLTTPGIWRVIDGVLVTDFFILKDLPLLGLGFILMNDEIA